MVSDAATLAAAQKTCCDDGLAEFLEAHGPPPNERDTMSNDTTTIYTTIGSVRGCCGHRHRSAEAAERCLDRDRARCAEHGGYSDRTVVAGESPVGVLADIDTGEPYHPHGRTSRAATVDDIGARV